MNEFRHREFWNRKQVHHDSSLRRGASIVYFYSRAQASHYRLSQYQRNRNKQEPVPPILLATFHFSKFAICNIFSLIHFTPSRMSRYLPTYRIPTIPHDEIHLFRNAIPNVVTFKNCVNFLIMLYNTRYRLVSLFCQTVHLNFYHIIIKCFIFYDIVLQSSLYYVLACTRQFIVEKRRS